MLLEEKRQKAKVKRQILQSCLLKKDIALILLLLISNFYTLAQNPIPPIGYWREHLNYQNTIQVVKGDKIYCATANNVFSIDANNTAERYSKVTGLNELGVNCIVWDDLNRQLVIIYNNSDIDLLKGSTVNNI